MEEQLKVSATTDDLTGLLNRRGFHALAEQQCKIAGRKKTGFSLLYLDLDNMKTINDRHGHKEGDRALKDASQILKYTFRESDIIGRIGGDEFAVLLTEPSGPDIEDVLFSHINANMKSHNDQGKQDYHLSFSMGLSYFDPEHPNPIDNLLNRADAIMYENKKRNQKEKPLTGAREVRAENRTSERIETVDGFWAEIGESDKEMIKNISTGGFCLSNMHLLMTNKFHSMTLSMDKERIPARAIMVWSKLMDTEDYEVGLKFIGLSERDRQKITGIIKDLSH